MLARLQTWRQITTRHGQARTALRLVPAWRLRHPEGAVQDAGLQIRASTAVMCGIVRVPLRDNLAALSQKGHYGPKCTADKMTPDVCAAACLEWMGIDTTGAFTVW